jgi:hypothetical protein
MNNPIQYLTTAQAGAALGVTEGRIRQFVIAGQMPRTLRHGSSAGKAASLLIDPRDVEALRGRDTRPGRKKKK